MRARRVGAGGLLLLGALSPLAGCGSASHPTAEATRVLTDPATTTASQTATATSSQTAATMPVATTAAVPPDLRVHRVTWGGMCPGGPCGTDLVIDASGAWTVTNGTASRSGTLTPPEVAALADGARTTRLDTATGTPDCAATYDGTSTRYAWTVSGVTGKASSCEHPIDTSDPLYVELEKVARTLAR